MANTAPKPFVFVLMPFLKEFDDVYQLGIKPACVNAGAYAERVDEQLFHESILDRIYNQIAKAGRTRDKGTLFIQDKGQGDNVV